MKFLSVCLLVLAAASCSADHITPALKQQTINRLLYRITEPLAFDSLKEYATSFDPKADTTVYEDEGVSVKNLLEEIDSNRVLQQRHWFSLFNKRQREESLMLFEALMKSKCFDTFAKTASYFRERMNEGEFIYALYAFVIHSELATGVVLPPLYEVTPHMFTNSEIIQKAYSAQMTQVPGKFKMEFTGSLKNPEQHVAYFGEDIGMNAHHVTWHLDFPFWWDDKYGYNLDRKGELFFWVHHQLSVRFDAERLSNNLDPVDSLYWNKPIKEGFAPHTTYRYGGEFPTRPDNVDFEDVDGIVRVRDMIIHESRIRDAIAHGYITTSDGSQIDIRNEKGIDQLGNIMESSLYSPNVQYYGALHNEAHILLGRQGDPHGKFNLPPSVMEHFETATRDPAFFRLHKYMDGIFKEHKDTLKPYTKDQIGFPGVTLKKISIDGDLETFFESFEFDLAMAVDSSKSVEKVDVIADVSRLNHKEFAYDFEIENTNEEAHAVVRVFMCPNNDNNGIEYSMEEARWNCIEMDKFWTKLSTGTNTIKRKSTDSAVTTPDIPSFQSLVEKADAAAATEDGALDLGAFDRACGIPSRMLLPKGSKSGVEFTLFAAVTDSTGDEQYAALEDNSAAHSHAQCGLHGEKYPDGKPMGFPMDRRIEDDRIFRTSDNIEWTIVKVFFRE